MQGTTDQLCRRPHRTEHNEKVNILMMRSAAVCSDHLEYKQPYARKAALLARNGWLPGILLAHEGNASHVSAESIDAAAF
mmetsp:Transcript_39476/g.72825  ORF Transcript_39476/g.72825 Transcript_39476/m.72825 type:complete len:80 (-) Transcript_39476:475-714(-)